MKESTYMKRFFKKGQLRMLKMVTKWVDKKIYRLATNLVFILGDNELLFDVVGPFVVLLDFLRSV